MKQNKLIFLLLSLPLLFVPDRVQAGEPTTDRVVLSDLEWDADAEAYVFAVSLEGSRIYTAYNMDIFLPDGIDVLYDGEGDEKEYYVIFSEDEDFYPFTKKLGKKTFKHQVSAQMPHPHQLRIACLSQEHAEFTATEGVLFYVYVSVDVSKFATSFSPKPIVTVSGVALTQKENAQQWDPEPYKCRPFSVGIPAERTLPVNVSSTNKVGTLILPFDAALPERLLAYTCSAADETTQTLTLTPAESLTACTPYLIYAENGYSGTLSGTVDMDADYPLDDIYPDGYFTGVLTATVVNTGYIMQNQGSGPMFYKADGHNFNLPAGRCYLTPTDASGVKSFAFNFDSTPTSIDTLPSSGEDGKGPLYTLDGRRVTQPVRGLYIQNHRKVLK